MRLIDADELDKVKFHELPYTHIVPADLLKLQTEAYERGWNDAIDAIMESADTIDAVPVRHGKWLHPEEDDEDYHTVACSCSVCGWEFNLYEDDIDGAPYCPVCGAKMEPVSSLYQVEGATEEGPTAEAVPEVRCKDCKHFTPGRYVGDWGMCTFEQSAMPEYSSCAWGERKAEP